MTFDADQYMEQYDEFTSKNTTANINADYYESIQLRHLGFKCGDNCLVSKHATYICPQNITFGNNVRIDPYTIISAHGNSITFEDNIHVSTHCTISGGSPILIKTGASLAKGSSVLSTSDTTNGEALVGPCQPGDTRLLQEKGIVIGAYSCVLLWSTVLPGGSLGFGAVLNPYSLTVKPIPAMQIWESKDRNQAIFLKSRRDDFLRFLSPDQLHREGLRQSTSLGDPEE